MGPRERGRELIYVGGQLWLLSKEVLKDMGPHGYRGSENEAARGNQGGAANGNCRRPRRTGRLRMRIPLTNLGSEVGIGQLRTLFACKSAPVRGDLGGGATLEKVVMGESPGREVEI